MRQMPVVESTQGQEEEEGAGGFALYALCSYLPDTTSWAGQHQNFSCLARFLVRFIRIVS